MWEKWIKAKLHLEELVTGPVHLFLNSFICLYTSLIGLMPCIPFHAITEEKCFYSISHISLYLRDGWQLRKGARNIQKSAFQAIGFHLKHCLEEDIKPFEMSNIDEWNMAVKYFEGTGRTLFNSSRECKKLTFDFRKVKDWFFRYGVSLPPIFLFMQPRSINSLDTSMISPYIL